MTRNEMIEAIANYFRIDLPQKDENGNYIINDDEWRCGGTVLGNDGEFRWDTWQILIDTILNGMFTDEDDEEWC